MLGVKIVEASEVLRKLDLHCVKQFQTLADHDVSRVTRHSLVRGFSIFGVEPGKIKIIVAIRNRPS